MTEQDNIELVQHFYDDVWNGRDLAVLKKIFAEDVETGSSAADPEGMPEGLAGLEALVGMYQGSFSDARIEVEEIFATGPWVTVLWTGRGTHDGEFVGIPATGNEVEVSGIDVHRVEDGLIVESRSEFDQLGFMVQLGQMEPFGL